MSNPILMDLGFIRQIIKMNESIVTDKFQNNFQFLFGNHLWQNNIKHLMKWTNTKKIWKFGNISFSPRQNNFVNFD